MSLRHLNQSLLNDGHKDSNPEILRQLLVTVLAMLRRYRNDSEESYRSRCKVAQWELPLVEVVFDDNTIG